MTEQQVYEVLEKYPDFELRRYPDHLVAEIGINAGPVIGGLVGRRKFIYDLWGDTVKLARGIESDGKTSILVTRPVYERVRDLVPFGAATSADVRGMGPVELFSLLDEATA